MPRNNLYWHFAKIDGDGTPRLRYGDNREVKVGETIKVNPAHIEVCIFGLHASKRIEQAIEFTHASADYALCRVKLGGRVIHQTAADPSNPLANKGVASERTVLAMWSRQEFCQVVRQALAPILLKAIKRHWKDAPEAVTEYIANPTEEGQAAAYKAIKATLDNYPGNPIEPGYMLTCMLSDFTKQHNLFIYQIDDAVARYSYFIADCKHRMDSNNLAEQQGYYTTKNHAYDQTWRKLERALCSTMETEHEPSELHSPAPV